MEHVVDHVAHSGQGVIQERSTSLETCMAELSNCVSGEQIRAAVRPARSQWGAVTTSEPAVIMEEDERPRWEHGAQEPDMMAPDDGGTGFIEGGTELPSKTSTCRCMPKASSA